MEFQRELLLRLESRTREAGELHARLQLTERAESTLREALEREREGRRPGGGDLRTQGAILVAEGLQAVTVPDWVGTVAPAFTALAAWAALVFSIYNAYALRRDRKPRVEISVRWNLPSDSPQVMRGPGFPATADPGRTVFECEITNVGMVGVKIREVYMWIYAPPGKPIPLHLPQGEQPKKLDNGDSQLWLSNPFNFKYLIGNGVYWTNVLALDSAGNSYRVASISHAKETERRLAMKFLSAPLTASVVGTKGAKALRRSWWRRWSRG